MKRVIEKVEKTGNKKAAAKSSTKGRTARLPKIAILATGGTIAGRAASGAQLTGYKSGVISAGELVAAVPEIRAHARITAEQISNIDSSQMNIPIWLALAKRINRLLAGDTDGVVVTHGTDTMEETAYFLNLTVRSDKPVVLVGAMRPATAISADGPLNLLQAVVVAASREARGRGVLVAMNGSIDSARSVTKTNTLRVDTFNSPELGRLGYIVQDKPVLYGTPSRRHTLGSEFDVSGLDRLPAVEIVYSYAGASPDAARGVLAGKPAGIVSGGVGDGLIYGPVEEVLRQARRQGVVVARSSRTGTGVTTREPSDAADDFVAADNLTPQKARILLMLALTATSDTREIQRMFGEY